MTSGRPASHAVHVRAFEQSDLDGAAALWSEASSRHQPAVFPLAEVVNALAADNMGLIAERDGTLIGAAVVQLLRDHAWVLRLAVIADESGESVCDALLAGLISELAARGARRVSLLLPDGAVGAEALTTHQFSRRGGVSYYHRFLVGGGGTDVVACFGGRHIPPGLLDSLAEYFWQTEEQQNPVVDPDIESRGYHVQVGFMVVPRVLEAGIRYAEVNGNIDVPASSLREIRGGLGYFWRGHNLKVQADVGQLRYEVGFAGLTSRARAGLPGLGTRLVTGEALGDRQVRVQAQVVF